MTTRKTGGHDCFLTSSSKGVIRIIIYRAVPTFTF